jgi:hypothetical protein
MATLAFNMDQFTFRWGKKRLLLAKNEENEVKRQEFGDFILEIGDQGLKIIDRNI